VHFEKALMLAKFLGNRVQERRAVRGLAAASRIQVRRQTCLQSRGVWTVAVHLPSEWSQADAPCCALLRLLLHP
jgi:hypothetical protein